MKLIGFISLILLCSLLYLFFTGFQSIETGDKEKNTPKVKNIGSHNISDNDQQLNINKIKQENISDTTSAQNRIIFKIPSSVLSEKGTKEIIAKEEKWVPLYKNAISRSTSKAYFQILDARGKPLEKYQANRMQVRLWRQINKNQWIEKRIKFDAAKNIIVCEGQQKQGLEPGFYSLELDGKGYGQLKFNFNLSKNRDLHGTYFLPNFRKIITIHFIDYNGNNILFTDNVPSYSFNEVKNPFKSHWHKKRMFLKEPTYDNSRRGGSGRFVTYKHHTKSYTKSYTNYICKTDEGKYYIRVFVGQEGSLNYKFSPLENIAKKFEIKSKFENDRNNEFIIEMNAVKYDPKKTTIRLKKDAGRKSLLKNQLTAKEPQSSEVKFNYNATGISYHLDNLIPKLHLEYKGMRGSVFIKRKDNVFERNFHSMPYNNDILIRWTDKELFQTNWEVIPLDENLVTYRYDKLDLIQFRVNLLLSPTFNKMLMGMYAVTALEKQKAQLFVKNNQLYFTSYILKNENKIKTELSNLHLDFKGFYYEKRSEFRNYSYDRPFHRRYLLINNYKNLNLKIPLAVDRKKILKNKDHEITLKPLSSVLILRLIDEVGVGLPWVESSLVCHDHINTAIGLKRIIENSTEKVFFHNFKPTWNSEKKHSDDKNISEQDLKLMGKLKSLIQNKKALKYILKNKTWYNIYLKGLSDAKGYMTIRSDEIIPGKKYTLFLWSNSKDHLKPDKEITFTAKKGITDLGALKI
ncbi:MAG: hypothetical protein COA79_18100 [Planctomycetota bacterium]|nr:MAG: hypothetical protein COA79_18100 [Planctomycetota bacterium]